MKKLALLLLTPFLCSHLFAQLHYHLIYADSANKLLRVEITLASAHSGSLRFVMPRFIPGNYSAKNYQLYINEVIAEDAEGNEEKLQMDADGAPGWQLDSGKLHCTKLRYTVDIDKMEREEMTLSDASVIRSQYAGLLNYSIFGWMEGMEKQPIQVQVSSFPDWPIFSTIAPRAEPSQGEYRFNCSNYAELADGQTLMGPGLRVKTNNAPIPIFVAAYSDTADLFLDDMLWQAQKSMDILRDYFGSVPFAHYTVVKQAVRSMRPPTGATLAMEHRSSVTLLGDVDSWTPPAPDSATRFARIFGILHHMGHAYIPLGSYGDNYQPYPTEIPMLIRNIWYNEGFIWYLCIDTLKSKYLQAIVESGVNDEPPALKALGIIELSQLASLQYGDDFRIGRAVFSRGAAMAAEMNVFIRARSGGRSSMRQVLRYLYQWSLREKRPFTLHEFPQLLNQGAGMDVSPIYQKWLKPLE